VEVTTFLDAIRSGRVILMDGAMGTELIHAGLTVGERGEVWNLTHSEIVTAVHQQYVEAGAACLVTNTFLAREAFASTVGRGSTDWNAINQRGVELARACVQHRSPFVLGSSGPPPLSGAAMSDAAQLELAATDSWQQLRWLAAADGILLETQPSVRFINAMLQQATPSDLGVPLVVSFTFAGSTGGPVCYAERLHPDELAKLMTQHQDQITALGVNCGRDVGLEALIPIVRGFRQILDLPILARPNAGTPRLSGDRWLYPQSPQQMAARLPALVDAGATLVGGCCGTTPAHIAAFREVLDRLGVLWQP
jgi:5-methyltetrahydrofolate--homocysteine methyltransferase